MRGPARALPRVAAGLVTRGSTCRKCASGLPKKKTSAVLFSFRGAPLGCTLDHHVSPTIVCRSMAIRFQCASCSQPIEVDDEWASKAVACPYCRKTVTAPAESTLDQVAQIPTASPLGTPPGGVVVVEPPSHGAPQGVSANRVAVAAMILACSTVVLLKATEYFLAPHSEEINRLREAQTFAEMMEIQSEFFKETGGLPEWMVGALVCEVSAGLAWVGAIVCGVIGVRRVRRRQLAVFALVITALVPIFFCCGGLVGAGP